MYTYRKFMRKFGFVVLICCITSAFVACSSKDKSANGGQSSLTNSNEFNEKLKTKLCSFLSEQDMQAIVNIDEKIGVVSGYDGTTGHYCSYSWNDFEDQIKFGYVIPSLGHKDKVNEALQSFKDYNIPSSNLTSIKNKGAFWNDGSGVLTVFFDDAQIYVDVRKTKLADKEAVAKQVVEKALQKS
ncbi:MAG: hypothetical protein ACFCUU_19480 [Cyclobacteriaceae bacterium]